MIAALLDSLLWLAIGLAAGLPLGWTIRSLTWRH
jgi:hypothetical protein